MENNAQKEVAEKQSTKKFLIIYCIAIFVFAVALIAIAAFSQRRIERDAAALVEKAENAEDIAADKSTLLDGVMTENKRLTSEIERLNDLAADKSTLLDNATAEKDKLQSENDALKSENNTLKTENETLTEANTSLTTKVANLEQREKALQSLTEIVNLKRTGKKRKEAVEAFEAAGFPGILTPDELAIYNSVK
ncbi:MAG: hypothetical protein IJO09_04720 [Oscillospiraceae bacterium]|nr:hypothetical protein [Oscillospiraceae bacterium]